MAKLSVIIPVYNVEKYLRRCLDSVTNQTFKDIEIIIINDASTDNSQEIIDEFKSKDPRIISIINKNNINLGLTRNVGIEISKSEYITFLDSDDWIEKNMYDEMMKVITKNNADIVEVNFISTNKNNRMGIKSLIPYFKKSGPSINKYIIHLKKNELGIVVWNKIYKSKLIKNIAIKFVDNNKIFCEDLMFNLKIIHHVKSIVTINKTLHHYFVRENSLSKNSDFINLEKTIDVVKNFIENNFMYESFKSDFYEFSIMVIPFIKYSLFNKMKNSIKPIESGLKILKEINENKLMITVINNSLKNKNLPLIDKIFCLMIELKLNYIIVISVVIIRKLIKYFNKIIFKINKYFLKNVIKTNISQ